MIDSDIYVIKIKIQYDLQWDNYSPETIWQTSRCKKKKKLQCALPQWENAIPFNKF